MRTPKVTPGKVPFFLSSAPFLPQVLLRPALLNRFRPLLVLMVLLIALGLRQPSTMNLKAVFFWNSSCQGKSTCSPCFFWIGAILTFFFPPQQRSAFQRLRRVSTTLTSYGLFTLLLLGWFVSTAATGVKFVLRIGARLATNLEF